MQIPVLIEPVAGNGYRGRVGEPFVFTVEGATRDEVLQKLRKAIEEKQSAGAEVVGLKIPPEDNAWLRMAGTLDPNDPMVQEWERDMAEYRRKVDEDPDYL
jgi:hypothetical protein